mmetsp:Transcript_47575/g.132273  ORF Transcript_47575/g.132273 Transcript_47575/m.132273 type:complete len:280 (-) Transcript_47575:281-1120(-)
MCSGRSRKAMTPGTPRHALQRPRRPGSSKPRRRRLRRPGCPSSPAPGRQACRTSSPGTAAGPSCAPAARSIPLRACATWGPQLPPPAPRRLLLRAWPTAQRPCLLRLHSQSLQICLPRSRQPACPLRPQRRWRSPQRLSETRPPLVRVINEPLVRLMRRRRCYQLQQGKLHQRLRGGRLASQLTSRSSAWGRPPSWTSASWRRTAWTARRSGCAASRSGSARCSARPRAGRRRARRWHFFCGWCAMSWTARTSRNSAASARTTRACAQRCWAPGRRQRP